MTYLTDVKTSRAVRDTHIAQLAAYGAASMAVVEVPEGTEGAVEYKGSWFADKTLPGFQKYAIVQIRPDDYDPKGNLIPAFCKLHVLSQDEIDAGNLWVDPGQFDLLKLRYALGLGLRIGTPIGPLAFDYGINLLQYSWEDFGAFHFSIGLF